ncbi:UDP-glucose 4-epimerase family protein [Undibacterium sp. Dicai25W]|uniref:UDP-glucose 4-epimerase family protein n=1 Tax=Undibacterium sp. Dicai25W TaxID=3413034 RepID=UPI003BF13411
MSEQLRFPDKSKILLTGASGFVGQAIYRALVNHSERLICPTRRPINKLNAEVSNPHLSDLSAQTDWSGFLADVGIVIHCAARVHVMQEAVADPLPLFRQVNVDATMRLAEQAAKAGATQFIFISSVKVNGEGTKPGHAYNETTPSEAQDPYGISKREAENALLALGERSGMHVTIIRPPLIYGPGVKANFASMLNWVEKGIPLPFASIKNKRSFVYLENLVSLVLCCLRNQNAAQQVFLVSDDHDLSTAELLQLSAKALHMPSRLLPFPPKLLILLAKLARRPAISDRLCGSLQVDISKAKQVLGWTPPYSVEQGLAATMLAKSA